MAKQLDHTTVVARQCVADAKRRLGSPAAWRFVGADVRRAVLCERLVSLMFAQPDDPSPRTYSYVVGVAREALGILDGEE